MDRAKDYARGPVLRHWVIKAGDEYHHVDAHYSDGGKDLVFRRYIDDDAENRTYVVMAFAQGKWDYVKEVNREDH